MKRIMVVGLSSAMFAASAALLSHGGRSNIVDERSARQRKRDLRRVEVEAVTSGSYWASPSPRKSKGEKKRAASDRRKNGWK